MTSDHALDEFGERLVRHVRGLAMPQCRLLLRLEREGAGMDRLRAVAASAGGQLPPNTIIPECVDRTIGYILYTMDDADLLHLSFMTQAGETTDMSVVGWGEPAGWYMGVPGWRSWYSSERIPDRYDLPYIRTTHELRDDSDDPAPILDELEMPRRAIEELGILLVRHVRDIAIRSCDEQLLPTSNTPTAQRWRRIAAEHNGVVPPEFLIPDCVDETIVVFLRAIDQGLLPLSFVAENGDVVDLVKDGRGELAARYADWRAKYSQQRRNDDAASD